jgi:hypothetical protein
MVDDGLAIERFWEQLDIPEACFLNKRVFKKLFEENGTLDTTDKKALKDDVVDYREELTQESHQKVTHL